MPHNSYALTQGDVKSILLNTANFDANDTTCSDDDETASSDISAASLSGSDNMQKAYNFYVGKGFSPQQSAAIVGNFVAESSVNPKSNQTGGAGKGIAQWGGGRLSGLQSYAAKNHGDAFSLPIQLGFTIQEFGGDYKGVVDAFKSKTNISDMTAYFMGTASAGSYSSNEVDKIASQYIAKYGRFPGYENPGTPRLDKRIAAAKFILQKYGGGQADGTGGSQGADSGVSGVNAGSTCSADNAAGQSASVDCTPAASGAAGASSLSTLRQNVVCLTQAELKLWTSGQMKAGNDFHKYSQGANELWCADFASWIYLKAGYPIGPSTKNWRVPAVTGIMQIGQKNDKFHYHSAGNYTPRPGDMVIRKAGQSHVNIVVSVNANNHTMVVTGGDQHGTGGANGNIVSSYTDKAFSNTNGITGYVSPD